MRLVGNEGQIMIRGLGTGGAFCVEAWGFLLQIELLKVPGFWPQFRTNYKL
jgi:hypothetical protein